MSDTFVSFIALVCSLHTFVSSRLVSSSLFHKNYINPVGGGQKYVLITITNTNTIAKNHKDQIKNEIVDEDWRDRRSAFNFDEADMGPSRNAMEKEEAKKKDEANEYDEEMLKKEQAIKFEEEFANPYGSGFRSFPSVLVR